MIGYAFPVALASSAMAARSPRLALGVMLVFHLFITSSIPMGVPIEWNVIMVYGALRPLRTSREVPVLGHPSPS